MSENSNYQQSILETDGTPAIVTAYCFSRLRAMTIYITYGITLGILKLVFHWYPHLGLRCMYRKCLLNEASKVFVKDSDSQYYALDVHVETLSIDQTDACDSSKRRNAHDTQIQGRGFKTDSNTLRCFVYKKIKYIWDHDKQCFEILRNFEEIEFCKISEAKPLTDIEVVRQRKLYGINEIDIPLTSIIVLLISRCLSPLYMFQLFGCVLWFFHDYWKYATCILVIAIISIVYELYQLHKNESDLRNTFTTSSEVSVLRASNLNGETTIMPSTELVPGDLIEILPDGCTMQCDAILLSGMCVVDESMLTGESIPIAKIPLIDSKLDNEAYNQHFLFSGTMVLQSKSVENAKVMAIVVRTGFHTRKGELVRSILYPKPVKFEFHQDTVRFLIGLGLVSLIGMAISVYLMIEAGVEVSKIVLRCLDIITIAIPPALPTAMTMCLVFAQRRLKSRNIFCSVPTGINVCGVINAACFDKTGTLTESNLDVFGAVETKNQRFCGLPVDINGICNKHLIECMATCHSVIKHGDIITGDPIDLSILKFTKWTLTEQECNNDEDDIIVPYTVRPPDNQPALATDSNIPYEIGILKQFPFSPNLKRMSVITRRLDGKHFDVYTKGAPETIKQICVPETVPINFDQIYMAYSMEGYRVLALAGKPVHLNYTQLLRSSRVELEQDLIFLGMIVLVNKLKPETQGVILDLKRANIRPLMITGDNLLTSLSVARKCGMISKGQNIFLMSVYPPNEQSDCELVNIQPHIEFHYVEALNDLIHICNKSYQIPSLDVKSFEDCDCMIHMRDFTVALTGDSWDIITTYYPYLIEKIVVKATVFARFKPHQKAQVVEALQSVGYFVSMCGDGANDCCALKTAHTGISLSTTEASVASPFTSLRTNVSCVLDLIMEGRCTLVTSFGTFKYMIGYSIVQFTAVILTYKHGGNFGDALYLYMDLFLVLTVGITFSLAHPYPYLKKQVPETRLTSLSTLISIGQQLLICVTVQITVFVLTIYQPWYMSLFVIHDDYELQNYDTYVLFIIACYQYIILAIVFSKGAPFRLPIYRNYLFTINIILCLAVSIYLNMNPHDIVANYMEIQKLPSMVYVFILTGIALANLLLSLIVENVLDTKFCRKNLMCIYRTICLKNIHPKYESINEEVQESYGSWPLNARITSLEVLAHKIAH